MNNSLIELYSYLLNNKELKDDLVSYNEKEFLSKETMLLSGLGLLKSIKDKLIKLDKVILLNNYLKDLIEKIFVVDVYLINEYNEINGYLIYDFLLIEYDIMIEKIKVVLLQED